MIKNEKTIFNVLNYDIYGEIFYPENVKEKIPGIVFCQGIWSWVEIYRWIAEKLAEAGYTVILFDYPSQGKSNGIFQSKYNLSYVETPIQYIKKNWQKTTSEVLTYLVERSPVKEIIDKRKIGIIGHSLGGQTTTQTITKDKRFKAAVVIAIGHTKSVKKIDIPIQFQGGDRDLAVFSIPILKKSYKLANNPKEMIWIERGTHEGFHSFKSKFTPVEPSWQKNVSIVYAVAWFDYFLKQKKEAYEIITKGHEHLSKHIKSMYNFGNGDIILK